MDKDLAGQDAKDLYDVSANSFYKNFVCIIFNKSFFISCEWEKLRK